MAYFSKYGVGIGRPKKARSPLQKNADEKMRMLANVGRAANNLQKVFAYCGLQGTPAAKQLRETILGFQDQVKAEYLAKKHWIQKDS